MDLAGDLRNLEQLIDRIDHAAAQRRKVKLDHILDEIGHRSFGPIVLMAGLITLAPLIGDIPGVPTLMALMVLLTAGQMLFRRKHIWMPRWIVGRTLPSGKLRKGLEWCRKPARMIDRIIKPRFTHLVNGPGLSVLAVGSVAVALAMPAMEIVPFSANGGGLALVMFGLAMISRDGILALLALIVTGGTFAFILNSLL